MLFTSPAKIRSVNSNSRLEGYKQNLNLPQGAGIQAAKTIVDHKADVLISGNCGPKAFDVLNAAGVKIVTGGKGRVIDAITQYKNGQLKAADEPNVEGHWV